MNVQPNSAPVPTPLHSGAAAPKAHDDRTPEQKAQHKAEKKERKNARLRFFFGWCEGVQAFGSAF
ncbi:hypothetical protein Q3A66_03945 [Hymenobacter sp. BT770]|uniref:hypothetical protein n=1 Tax=Hymenobacter sp. BT770 TaxID=2886942 RepID=UPI001D11295D|nr:hypothetical protein [Hymenobacter sp. BT770]MCC3155451.1 hypothetical protein [Hymenobacter sp. BT770]MDO3414209.1 hypothetical protein [Hymenobacter sp. BT770]